MANQVMFNGIVHLNRIGCALHMASKVTLQETVGTRETNRGHLHKAAGVPAYKPNC